MKKRVKNSNFEPSNRNIFTRRRRRSINQNKRLEKKIFFPILMADFNNFHANRSG